MYGFFIKYFFIFLSFFFLNNLIQNKKDFSPKLILAIMYSFLLSFITCFCYTFIPFLSLFVPIFILSVINFIYNPIPQLAFSLTLISFALSYSLFIFSFFIIAIILAPSHYHTFSFNQIKLYLLTGILQFFMIGLLKRIKRFSHGMNFIYTQKSINTGTLIGLLFCILITFSQLNPNPTIYVQAIVTLCIPLILLFLLHWWQSQLTKAYRKRLAQLELESLRTELEQKTALLKKLETQNEEMGRLIHKDNKLIPAMEHAVSSYLASGFTDIVLQQAQGEALLSDLKEFSEARRGILSTFAPISAPKYNTGIPSLDAILVYMYQKAQVQDIRFYAAATPESIAALPPALTTEKLVHMLSDLLENAIIATKTSTEKQIQVQIYLANGLFTIEVADTGCSFEPATLISFGLEKASTHLTEGGSGIGLLDIWKIKEETKASIHIHEYEAGAPFSKKLFITFDKKNKYVIHTWRDKELSPLVTRGDIVILPQEQV